MEVIDGTILGNPFPKKELSPRLKWEAPGETGTRRITPTMLMTSTALTQNIGNTCSEGEEGRDNEADEEGEEIERLDGQDDD